MRHHPLTVFNFSVKNQSDDTVDIHIDGYIVDSATKEILEAYWGDETSTSFKSFREQVPANVKTINLFINSGGGHVGDAMAIHDYLLDLEAQGVTINRKTRGITASAGTYLSMGRNSEMSKNSWFMIHNVSGFAYGDVTQVENQAKTLRKFNDRIVKFYAENTGLSETVISNMMNKETWLTADEAKEKGFIKSVTGDATFTNSIKPEHWQFQNTTVLNAYNSFTKPFNTEDMKIENISKAIENGFNTLMEKLGIKDKANDESVKNAFTEFSIGITNALKDEVPTDEKVQEMVNKAIGNLAENESFKTAIANATKDTVTKTDLENATKDTLKKDDLKNVVNKEDLEKSLKESQDAIVNALSNKLGNKGGTKTGEQTENKDRRVVRNRFSGAYQDFE